jgi:hypothetical protein
MTTKKTASKATASKKASGASAKAEGRARASSTSAKETKTARPTNGGKAKASPKTQAKPKASKAPAKPAAPKATKRAPSEAAVEEPVKAKAEESAGRSRSTSVQAVHILESETPAPQIAELGLALLDGTSTRATNAARVLSEIAEIKIEAVVPLVDKFVKSLPSKNKRVVQTAADALPNVARIAPARVARHLEILKTSFAQSSPIGKDGLVRTFAALCTASVAYQKRLEPVLTFALGEADGKVLLRWSQIVLPALKGEPHARARAVVEARLERIPRAYAQQIADFLGIKLRARYR